MDVDRIGDQAIGEIVDAGQYAVEIDGEIVPILSLPPGALGQIQSRTGFGWNRMIVEPLVRLDVAADLVAAVLAKVGKDPRDFDTEDLVRLFVKIPGDLPDPEPRGESGEGNPTDAS